MIKYDYSEFAKGGAVHFWRPESDFQIVMESLPEPIQKTIRWAGYYAVNGTLRMSSAYDSVTRRWGYDPDEKRYDFLKDGVDPVMSQHVWRSLKTGIEAESILTDAERMKQALESAREVRAITENWCAIDGSLDGYRNNLLSVARGIHDVAAVSVNDPHGLVELATQHYQEAVLEPFLAKVTK